MKARKSLIFIAVLLIMTVAFPAVASAKADEYGYNAKARTFIGTLDNWDAFLSGTPPTPFSWKDKNVIFLFRTWDKAFDPMIQGNPPSASGAQEKAVLWEYLTGDQAGWTWHEELTVVYSPNAPIPGAIALTPDEILYNGFYAVKDDEWLSGPHGEKQVVTDLNVKRSVILKALHPRIKARH